ncbi:hypothetical protein [Botrimarina mediterranea]|uniref:hypothetical protein n=1 Tax=Botrimarina mediterranea TaxID=2528022 RepID=UPI0011A62433|nr:hypothetical protein [Botrimarina mediterranea]
MPEYLDVLGLSGDQQVREFFQNYNLSGVLSNRSHELLDLCSPTSQIIEATDFGRDTYGISENFVCLTSGEGEGFILYSKVDGKVYDVAVNQLDELEAGKIKARWQSFVELIEWYLS